MSIEDAVQPDEARPEPSATGPDQEWRRKALGALKRYRVMAWVTGTLLLLLCVELLLKAFSAPESVMSAVRWIPFAHGWVYVIYLATVLDLWSKMRWSFGRLATMVLAGVVPVMSFVLERKVHAEGVARVG